MSAARKKQLAITRDERREKAQNVPIPKIVKTGFKPELIGKPIAIPLKNKQGEIKDYITEYHFKGTSYENIKYIGNMFSQELKAKDKLEGSYNLQMSLVFPQPLGNLNGFHTALGDHISLPDPSEYGHATEYDFNNISSFYLYVIPTKLKAGGWNLITFQNDCLYRCLKKAIKDFDIYFKSNKELKEFLGLSESDLIPVEMIDRIEEKLPKHKITIVGDCYRPSMQKGKNEIVIRLEKGHYEIDTSNYQKLVNIPRYERKIIVVDKFNNSFDGKQHRIISEEEKKHYLKDRYESFNEELSPYIMVKHEIIKDIDDTTKNLNLEQSYFELIKIADNLKKESNGLLNFYKLGSFSKMIMGLFEQMNKTYFSEPLTALEELWNKESNMWALRYSSDYEGSAEHYDARSEYISMMIRHNFYFPIKQGKFETISDEEFRKSKSTRYGIYRCHIEYKPNLFFNYNVTNKYTHIDINRAFELGLKVTLIEDGNYNYLNYQNCLVSGKEIFYDTIMKVFDLKEKGIKGAKFLTVSFWGGLCAKNIKSWLVDTQKEDPIIYDHYEITEIDKQKNGYRFTAQTETRYYKTNWARIGPFLTSRVRCEISRLAQPYYNNIKHLHTDGFYSDIKLPLKIGDKLGQLKHKHFDNIKVLNKNKVEIKNE